MAVSRSPEQLRLWWCDPERETRSGPEILDGGRNRYVTSSNVRVTGTTVAIRIDYTNQPPWEDEVTGPETTTTAFAVCRAASCESSEQYDEVQEPPCERGSCRRSRPRQAGRNQVPELSADGSRVFFGVTERGYVVWDADDGLRDLQPRGLPTDTAEMGTPLLAPEGSFRVVAGHRDNTGCRLAAAPVDNEYVNSQFSTTKAS